MKQATVPGRTRRRIYLVTGFRALSVPALLLLFWNIAVVAREPAFKVLAFYSTDVEPDRVHTANDAIAFFRGLAAKNNFTFDATKDWTKLNENDLKPYRLILWLNNFPQTPSRGVDEHEIPNDLHEYGSWGKDLLRRDTKHAVRKRDSLAGEPEIVLPVAGKSGDHK